MDLLQKYEFGKLKTFMEDFTFLLQNGGAKNIMGFVTKKESITKKIVALVTLIFIVIVICIVLVILYKTIVIGYPRFAVNLATLSFFRKEKFEKILMENDTMFSNFDAIAFADSKTLTTLTEMYDNKVFVELGNKEKEARTAIDKDYSSLRYRNFQTVYRYRDKYNAEFIEYLLFYKIFFFKILLFALIPFT